MLPNVPQTREEVTLLWLQQALKTQPFKVLSFSWSGEVGGGIGVMSSLERLTLQILKDEEQSQSQLSIVVKTPPNSNPGLRSFVLSEGFCQREFQMYTKVFPSWKRFQDARHTPEKYRFKYPVCYYGAEEGEGEDYKMILLLQDMGEAGYSSWSQGYRKGLRWAQASLVVREMAHFHALGMAYKEHMGIKHYTGRDYDFLYTHAKDEQLLDTFLESGVQKTCEMLGDCKSVPEGLISDLKAFKDVRRLQELAFPRSDRAGTIAHQDMHIHNIMFSQAENNAALLDFQGCSYASPMADLTFFLLLNCDASLFSHDLLEVLHYYHDCFAEAIHAMDSDVQYPMEEILEDYHAQLFVSVVHIILGSPSWCFGPYTSQDTAERYKVALLDSYQRCNYRLGLDCLQDFVNYFSQRAEE